MDYKQPWYSFPKYSEEAGRLGTQLAKQLWQANQPYRTLCRRHLERYHGASLTPANWQFQFQLSQDLPLVWNLTRSFTGTIVSNVGASSNPKVQFVTSDADWKTRRRAQKLDQFGDALALVECPPYQSVHELRTALLRDAALFGRGTAQVSANLKRGQVITQRVLPWEILFDTRDCRYGVPTEICRAYPISRYTLHSMIESRDQDIDDAREATNQDIEAELGLTVSPTRVIRDQVQVYEIWLMANGKDEPGRHVMLLDGVEQPLIDEDYELEIPPLPTIYWDHPIVGGWNQSLADECASIEDEINRSLMRMSDAARRTALNIIFYKQDSVDKDIIEDTADSVAVPYTGQDKPTLDRAEMFNDSMVKWVELQRSVAHDITGVSEMAATGSRDPGVTAAVAMRAESAQQSKRFAWLWRQVEGWQVAWCKLAIASVRHIADNDPNFEVRFPGQKFLKSIAWKDVDLDEDKYFIQAYPVGQSKNTPEDRLQKAEELFVAGIISQQAYESIRQGSLDVPAETREQNVQRELINNYIENWLDATDEQMESGWIDEEKKIKLIEPPIKWLNMRDAIMQVALAYTEACLQGAPDANRQLFLDWLEMADSVLEQQEQRRAALMQATKGVSNQQAQAATEQAAL